MAMQRIVPHKWGRKASPFRWMMRVRRSCACPSRASSVGSALGSPTEYQDGVRCEQGAMWHTRECHLVRTVCFDGGMVEPG